MARVPNPFSGPPPGNGKPADYPDVSEGFAMVTPAHARSMSPRVLSAYVLLWCRFGKIQHERGSFAASYTELAGVIERTERNTVSIMNELQADGWVRVLGTSVYKGRERNRWRISRSAQEAGRHRKAGIRGVGIDRGGVSESTGVARVNVASLPSSVPGALSSSTGVLENTAVENPSSREEARPGPVLASLTPAGSEFHLIQARHVISDGDEWTGTEMETVIARAPDREAS